MLLSSQTYSILYVEKGSSDVKAEWLEAEDAARAIALFHLSHPREKYIAISAQPRGHTVNHG